MSTLRVGLVGGSGRLGREIAQVAESQPDVEIAGGVGHGDGDDALADLARRVDVLIDFSTPEGTMRAARAAVAARTPLVVGTTGLTEVQIATLRNAGETIPVWYARNMSHGVGVLLQLLPRIAEALADYDVELVEAHHRHKVDAPSGTALALAEAVQRGLDEERPRVFGREGHAPRQRGEVGIHAVRGGGNAGEHEIRFMTDDEEIRIAHRAFHRRVFASGALRAARRIATMPPGWYAPEEGGAP